MGKVRAVTLGDETSEKEQKKKAEARREAKKLKKSFQNAQDKHEGETLTTGELSDAPKTTEAETEETKTMKKKNGKKKTHSKRYQDVKALVDKNKLYSLAEAAALIKKTSITKFDGTVEIHVNLNPEMLGGKNDFRGTVNLPHGTGRDIRVVIADDTVIADLESGKINFDILIAHPSMMPKLAKFARTLGPKGLMPNPKNGTVSPDPEKRAKELAGGQMNFKTEPIAPIIHLPIGKVSFEESKIKENVEALILTIGKNKISRITLSSTMGPGIKVVVA